MSPKDLNNLIKFDPVTLPQFFELSSVVIETEYTPPFGIIAGGKDVTYLLSEKDFLEPTQIE